MEKRHDIIYNPIASIVLPATTMMMYDVNQASST